jgi:hypothetical protein
MKTIAGTVIMATILLALPARASAQEDDRWTPWLGCWTLVDEATHEGAGAARAALLSPPEPREVDPESEPRACVARVPGGVTITTTVPEQTPTVQTLLADDVSRSISDEECRGTERSSWSTTGRLLFARANVTCADAAPRTITGLGMITAQGQWLDVRTFRIDGRNTTRVSRYDRADNTPVIGHHLTVEEIKEASRIVSPTVIEAAIAETRPPLTVKSKQLLELADAQVPTSVIDVMVAVAYPKQFIVEPSRGGAGGSVYSAYGLYDPFFDAGYWPSYYYSPFAYGYIGRYNPIAFPPYGSGGVGDAVPPRGTGRAINGEGYTRVRPNTPERTTFTGRSGTVNSAASSGSATASSRASASSSSDGGSSSSSSSSGGGGGGGGASPQGYSSSGSDGGGRTAQPR